MADTRATSPALVVLAAGGGRRYGGLKQLAPVGPHGETLVEYSIYDALAAGIEKVVLVIHEEQERAFRDKFAGGVADHAEIEFVFQESEVALTSLGTRFKREKPWGTAHAVITAQSRVAGPFIVINADDFYGRSAIGAMARYLREAAASKPGYGALVVYPLRNTLSNFGPVNRGLCELDNEAYLKQIVECRAIRRAGPDGVIITDGGNHPVLHGHELVSMNLWGLCPEVGVRWRQFFQEFLERETSEESEFEIPGNVQRMTEAGELRIKSIQTDEHWFGLTYRDDLADVQGHIASRIDQGVYPDHLFQKKC
jgi:dTDP-glucose pyrophosphorylase